MTMILIPCKPLRSGKSRLGDVLSDDGRHILCRNLLAHTLDMARALVPTAQIRIVTNDAEARELATNHGVVTLEDRVDGLNDALTRARKACGATSLLVLPIDLPLASIDDFKVALNADADVTIAPDAANSGTNLLCLRDRAAQVLPFLFGPDSLRAHRQAAERLELSVGVLRRPGLAMDIDTPQDYADWRDGYALRFTQLQRAARSPAIQP